MRGRLGKAAWPGMKFESQDQKEIKSSRGLKR